MNTVGILIGFKGSIISTHKALVLNARNDKAISEHLYSSNKGLEYKLTVILSVRHVQTEACAIKLMKGKYMEYKEVHQMIGCQTRETWREDRRLPFQWIKQWSEWERLSQ